VKKLKYEANLLMENSLKMMPGKIMKPETYFKPNIKKALGL